MRFFPPRQRGERRPLINLRSAGVGDGTYTATYRVVSADSHPVSGGSSSRSARAAPRRRSRWRSVARPGGAGAGRPQVAFGIGARRSSTARSRSWPAGLVFLLFVWLPALARERGRGGPLARADRRSVRAVARAADRRARSSGGAGIGARHRAGQGATAGGGASGRALEARPRSATCLDTRFGSVWGLRLPRLAADRGGLAVARAPGRSRHAARRWARPGSRPARRACRRGALSLPLCSSCLARRWPVTRSAPTRPG